MNRILLLLIGIYSIISIRVKEDKEFTYFKQFIQKYSKSYSTISEFVQRFRNFKVNLLKTLPSEGTENSELFTPFYDLTEQEFKNQYLTLKLKDFENYINGSQKRIFEPSLDSPAPENWNWLEKGAVLPVKNQGTINSSTIFSAIGNIEGQYFLKTQKAQLFSERHLNDCSKDIRSLMMEDHFKYLRDNGGAPGSEEYPDPKLKDPCKLEKVKAKVVGYKFAENKDEALITQFLYEVGPLSVLIDASPLMYYRAGILDPTKVSCSETSLNHAVLLTGYGIENGKAYWIAKNSWGSSWGERGFFRITRGNGACGINSYVISSEIMPIQ